MQNRAEPQSLQPEKQEKVQSETALFFRHKAKVTYKESWVEKGSSNSLQPEKQEKVQSETSLFFRRKAKVTYKESWVEKGSSRWWWE
jgi:sarcosine oxidase delta subunit